MLHATLEMATAAGYLVTFMDTANDCDRQHRALATLMIGRSMRCSLLPPN